MNQTHSTLVPQTSRISVALCTYNGARYLEAQLQSLAGQSRLPDELVLCDDGSTDNTLDQAESFARTAPFSVRIHTNPQNLGYSRNFAQAVALCSGDVIALSDQDDLWYPNKLSRLSELFTQHPQVDGIFSNGNLIDSASAAVPGTLWGSFRFSERDQVRLRQGEAVDVLLQRNVVTGMAFAFRSAWKGALRHMPASWSHDAWLGLVLASENKLLACPEPLVAYRVHGNQKIGVPITPAEKKTYLRLHGVSSYLKLVRSRTQAEYAEAAQQFGDLLESLRSPECDAACRALQRQQGKLEAKAEHARTGAALLGLSPARRWPGVLRRGRNYEKYSSTGMRALLRDLVV